MKSQSKGFSTSIFVKGNQRAFLPWSCCKVVQRAFLPQSCQKFDQSASLSWSCQKVSQWASLPRSCWKSIRELLYLDLARRSIKATFIPWSYNAERSIKGLFHLDLTESSPKGFSTSILQKSRSKGLFTLILLKGRSEGFSASILLIGRSKGLLYLDLAKTSITGASLPWSCDAERLTTGAFLAQSCWNVVYRGFSTSVLLKGQSKSPFPSIMLKGHQGAYLPLSCWKDNQRASLPQSC